MKKFTNLPDSLNGGIVICSIYVFAVKVALPGGDATSLHLGNAVCVLGALLLGGVYGGLGGAIWNDDR